MKRILKIIGISFLVCCLLCIVKNEFSHVLFSHASSGLKGAQQKEHVDGLWIGSSMFGQGVNTSILSSELDHEHFKLAYNGNQPLSEYLQLKYLIEQDVDIDRLFLDLYVNTAMTGFEISDSRMLLDAGMDFKTDILQYYDEKPFSLLYETFVSANNELLLTYPISYPMINNRYDAHGGTVNSRAGSTIDALGNAYVPIRSSEFHPRQMLALQQIIDLAQTNGIEVFFVETPKYIRMMDSREYRTVLANYVEAVHQPNVSLILADSHGLSGENIFTYSFPYQETNYFADMIHLSSEGQKVFSEMLSDLLDEPLVSSSISSCLRP